MKIQIFLQNEKDEKLLAVDFEDGKVYSDTYTEVFESIHKTTQNSTIPTESEKEKLKFWKTELKNFAVKQKILKPV